MQSKGNRLRRRGIIFGVVVFAATAFFLSSVNRQPKPLPEKWKPFAAFLMSADRVETVATTFDFFPFDKPPEDIPAYLAKKEPGGKHLVQQCDKPKREAVIKLLASAVNPEGPVSACFCPHHFVIAQRGGQRVVLSICFTCSSCRTNGGFELDDPIDKGKLGQAAEVFGIDLRDDRKNRKCWINDGVSGELPH